ncbi:UNVERIFIED_ORG: lysophospholipase L1-like esterase [Shinella zoogloeoides]|nr:lysophospholipase L1-like esterase [Shinella zoogloeoides]
MTQFFDFAVLGTSLSAPGYDITYVPNLIRALKPGSEDTVRCYNFAVSGGNSGTTLSVADRVINLRPKAVLIETQTNDCAALSAAQSTSNINALIDQLQAGTSGTAIFLMTMNKVLGTQASSSRAQLETFNDIYRAVALAQGVTLLDLYPLWASATSVDIPDDLHPTVAAVTARSVPAIKAALQALM